MIVTDDASWERRRLVLSPTILGVLSLLCPDLGLPASCCGIPEAPGAPGSFFPSSPTSTGKPPDCRQIPPQILPLAQMRREAPRGFASLPPQASEIPEIPECGRR
eukprot:superscaffoldBa00004845_g19521